jgi:hypothetical protein
VLRLVVKISIVVPLTYLGGMSRIGRGPFGVACQATRIADSKLTGEVSHHNTREIRWVRKKSAQKAHRAQLCGIAQPVVNAAMCGNFAPLLIVQEEIFGELSRRRVSIVTAVSARLFRREKVYRHVLVISSRKSTPSGLVSDLGEEMTDNSNEMGDGLPKKFS